jgi:Tripartite tricarboxylate transporter TctB family
VADSPAAEGSRRVDALAATAVLAVAGVGFAAAWREPPPFYDSLGPGAVPMAVSVALFALGLTLLVRALLGLRIGQATQSLIGGLDAATPEIDYMLRPGLAVLAYAATVAYVGAIAIGLPFFWSTLVFLAGLGSTIARLRRPLTYWILGVSVIATFLVDFLFRRVLLVPLP